MGIWRCYRQSSNQVGDEYTWLTVSPFRGNVSGYSGDNDSVIVKSGHLEFVIISKSRMNYFIESGNNVAEVAVGVGLSYVEEPNISPSKFELHQNYPNPFNPSTNIKFDLPENSHVTITIFNLVGQSLYSGQPFFGDWIIQYYMERNR